MCGRFAMVAAPQLIEEHFNVDVPYSWAPQYNLSPGKPALVVYYDSDMIMRVIKPMQWGFVPSWNKNARVFPKPINARIETIQTGYFRQAVTHNRCLIPATGYYEWRKIRSGKQPYFIKPKNSQLIALAGVWSQQEMGETVEHHFAVLTEPVNTALSFIHDRMPVIIAPDSFDTWLAHAPLENMKFFMAKRKRTELEFWPVTPKMSSAKYEAADCVKPVVLPNGQ